VTTALRNHEEIETAITQRRMAEWLAAAGIETVHLALLDASGTLREKRLGPGAAARAFEHGWSFIDAIQWWGPEDDVWRQGGSEHQRATVDPASARSFPFEASSAVFMAEFNGPLAQLSPRHQLQRMVERLVEADLVAEIGWEFECIVLESTPGGAPWQAGHLQPAMSANRCWSAQTMATDAEIIGGLIAALTAGDIPIDHVCAELGPGCLELALDNQSAVRSADNAAWAKIFTKAYFAQRGLIPTFMAQLDNDFPGLGGHPSLSFRSTWTGGSTLEESGGRLSKTALAAIGGITSLLPELLVMAAPNPNSYRRFGPGNWAPTTATWGIGNYSCALRVVADEPESTRLELRIPGADTNPHLCAAMLLGAAAWGIEHDLEAPPPVQAPDDGRQQGTGRRLPRDLTEAAERFAESAVAHALFGSRFVTHYAASRLVEASACSRFVSDQERRRYLGSV
jgi:glutamine synthetase